MSESESGCCGAVRLHTSEREQGLKDVKRRIDTWWPAVEAGIEAIVSSASGCGVTVKEYGHLLRDDPEYAGKAAKISELTVDLSELLVAEMRRSPPEREIQNDRKVAFQCPCSLQHGQKLGGQVESLLEQYNYTVLPVVDGHLCCGSAGTYSVLQPELSKQLKADKLKKLQAPTPDIIATANVGCQLHLRPGAQVPVVHWIELLDELI